MEAYKCNLLALEPDFNIVKCSMVWFGTEANTEANIKQCEVYGERHIYNDAIDN